MYERKQMLNTINSIEDATGSMFHDLHDALDLEIHELAWNDWKRLMAIRIGLQIKYNL